MLSNRSGSGTNEKGKTMGSDATKQGKIHPLAEEESKIEGHDDSIQREINKLDQNSFHRPDENSE